MKAIQAKRNNWSLLILLLAAGYCLIGPFTGGKLAGRLYPLICTAAGSGMMVLLGMESRRWLADRRTKLCAGLGLIGLGYLEKILIFWAETLTGLAPDFQPFLTTNSAWPLLAAGSCLLLSGAVEQKERQPKRLLLTLVAIGLAAGLFQMITPLLCLAQITAYAPFYAVGCLLDDQQLSRLNKLGGKLQKGAALLVLAGAGGLSLLVGHKLERLWYLFEGSSWYGTIKAVRDLLPLGIVMRLCWYVGAAAVLLALFSLAPGRAIPKVTRLGSRGISGYFWMIPGVVLAAELLKSSKSLPLRAVVLMGLMIWCLMSLSGAGEWLVRWMLETPLRSLSEESPRLGGVGFFQRHRWAIRTVCFYTVAFVVVMAAFSYPIFSEGRCMIWKTDGMGQQFPMMFYFKEYLLEGIGGLFREGCFTFPQWDFSLGFGMSPMDAVRREPFMLLCLLGNEQNMELIANISLVLRMYTCGLAFLWLCRTLGKDHELAVVMGALVYTFSGDALFTSIRQPYFITVLMTYGVLMLIGVERFLRQGKYGLFLGMVFLQLFGNYYSSYINGLVMAVYLLIRLICLYGKDIRKILTKILQLMGFYAWGAAMAMVTLLPGILALGGSSREAGTKVLDLWYNNDHMTDLFTGFSFEFGGAGDWSFVSTGAIAWIACVVLFLKRDRRLLPLKAGIVTAVGLISLPAFGMLANGFAYVSNRWCYAVVLAAALVLVEMVPHLVQLSQKEKGIVMLVTVVYSAVCICVPSQLDKLRVMGLVLLCMTALVVLVQDQIFPTKRMRTAILAVITVLTMSFHSAASFTLGLGNYANHLVPSGEAYQMLGGDMLQALETETIRQDESFYRIAQGPNSVNQSMALDFYGVNSYYSINPMGVSRYLTDVGMSSQRQDFRIYGLDERLAANALAAVKYYVGQEGRVVPYGCQPVETLENGMTLYENTLALPLGYTYDSYITQQVYDQLTPVERQQVMLESAVVDTAPQGLTENTAPYQEKVIPCQITETKGVKADEENKTIDAQQGGTMKLTFTGEPGCETYLVLDQIRFRNENSKSDGEIRVDAKGRSETGRISGKANSYYVARDALVFLLGNQEEEQETCTITFKDDLKLAYDQIYVVCVKLEDSKEQIEQLRSVTLEQVTEDKDTITGTISLEEQRMLALSIPYASGWRAWVDGQETPLSRVNVMYSGLMLEPGQHEIRLSYEHPGLALGTKISVAAILALIPGSILIAVYQRKQEEKSKKD